MLVNQIAVFLENKQGRLSALLDVLAKNNINLQSLNIADTNDFGIVRLVSSDNVQALDVLKEAGFTASSVNLVGIEVDDRPGALARLIEILSKEGISIEYIYSFTCSEGKNLILFKTADVETAQKTLVKHKI